ncbi:MAG: 50S ribosome-binding GTPase [Planctomycetes bacterium]|jgi:tRNA modification GTPase|nr:50S ribosome-binding GTPase [Planctomycetota bacterium]
MLGDTIVARASAPGASERSVLRLSGPCARELAARVFQPAIPARRAVVEGELTLLGQTAACFALSMPGPHSFTGEDVVELHVPGSPLLVQLLLDELLRDAAPLGARLAVPGEFTARAVQHGKLDGVGAEALLLLLHAADQRQLQQAVQWLRGGLAVAVPELRAALQDVLALVEVGLDFTDDETGAVAVELWRSPLQAAAARCGELLTTLPGAAPGGEVLLLGASNAGKSALANALAGRAASLVADQAGTTRDVLRVELGPGVAVFDAPGDLNAPGEVDAAALALRDRLAGGAAALLLVLDASGEPFVPPSALASPLPWFGVVWTKIDLGAPPPLPPEVAVRAAGLPVFATSARTGAGIDELRVALLAAGSGGVVDAGGPLRTALAQAQQAIERALQAPTPELVAVDLQAALRALDGVAGVHSPEALLDRIYGRFCLGK